MKKSLTLFGMTLVMATSTMFGATITYSATLPTNPVPFTDLFTLSAFNSSLGTLTGISLTLNYTDSATVSVFDLGSISYAYTNASATSTLTLNGPAGIVTSATLTTSGVNGTATPGVSSAGTVTGAGTASASPTNFAAYTSSSPLALSFSAVDTSASFNGTTSAPGSTVFFGGSFSAGGTVGITYTYTPPSTTPEPATMTLFGSALLGIGFFARKRIKKT